MRETCFDAILAGDIAVMRILYRSVIFGSSSFPFLALRPALSVTMENIIVSQLVERITAIVDAHS